MSKNWIIELAKGPFAIEELYNRVREKEGRMLDDDLVIGLPESGALTNHAIEWKVRKRSAEILLKAFNKAGRSLSILDVGCGNGWLSAYMSKAGHSVHALDVHLVELQQAARCFPDLNITWMYGDLLGSTLSEQRYDRIIFAASIQYFADPAQVLSHCFEDLLKPDGEVHIVDSPFYIDPVDKEQARLRSEAYYNDLGIPEMSGYYHHHTEMKEFSDYEKHKTRYWVGVPILSRRAPFDHVQLKGRCGSKARSDS